MCPRGIVLGGLRRRTCLHWVEPASGKVSIWVEGLHRADEQLGKEELEEPVSDIRSTCVCWEVV